MITNLIKMYESSNLLKKITKGKQIIVFTTCILFVLAVTLTAQIQFDDGESIESSISFFPKVTAPVGSIVAWHKSMSHTPTLPNGWIECNGQYINDSNSPYHGQYVPDLNGEKRFIRGNTTSGILQADQFQGHSHDGNLYLFVKRPGGWEVGGQGPLDYENPDIATQNAYTDGNNGTPRVGNETRPLNISMVWIMRIK